MELLARQGIRQLGRRLGVRAALYSLARSLGYDLVKRHFYSEVPDLDALPAGIWDVRSDLEGVALDVEAGLRFVQRELGKFLGEFHPPHGFTGNPRDYYLENANYGGLDAETLYAMVRRFRPARVLELGSGMSTLVIAAARARNGSAERDGHDVYDPYPRTDLKPTLEEVAHIRTLSATDIPLNEFTKLRSSDFLFVDTTHTVKIGSDVNRVILDVLPTLAPGVFVHFHDVFLPWEYPIAFFTELGFSWAEQYLLQAFLMFNREFEILFGNAALKREHPRQIAAMVPSATEAARPAAFWIRRVQPPRS